MSRFHKPLAACLALGLVFSFASNLPAEGKAWTVSFEEAKKMAAETGKDILMEFTGSDWCTPCKALHKAVLSKDVFLKKAPENYILLKLDNPRDKSHQTEEEIAQYKELSKKYKVTGVPTVFLADAAGKPFHRMVGYGGQKAEVYVAQITAKRAVRKARDEFMAKARKTSGVERAKLLDKAIGKIDSELALELYSDTVKEIVKLDAEDSAKLKSKYEKKLAAVELNGKLQGLMRTAGRDPEGTVKKIDELLKESKLEGESLQQALFMKAQLLFRSDKAESKKALEAAQKAAPDTRIGKQIPIILKNNFNEADTEEKK